MHAGFYYSADTRALASADTRAPGDLLGRSRRPTVKARFCRLGNEFLRDFCEENGIVVNRCGKVVVAQVSSALGTRACRCRASQSAPPLPRVQSPELVDQVDMLCKRGIANGVEVEARSRAGPAPWCGDPTMTLGSQVVTEAELRELEPLARTHEKALWSPNTWTAGAWGGDWRWWVSPLTPRADPRAVMTAMIRHARASGVKFGWGFACQSLKATSRGVAVTTSGVDVATVRAARCLAGSRGGG